LEEVGKIEKKKLVKIQTRESNMACERCTSIGQSFILREKLTLQSKHVRYAHELP
jgi:hypothetical protein